MPNYRRIWIPGGTYFFTVALADRQSALLTTHITELRTAFRIARGARPFATDAIVVLPDHIHAIWTLPPGDTDYATRWSHIKAMFSRALPASERLSASRARKRERGIWQRRYWARAIVDENDFAAHVDYAHINPVKHGLAACAREWPWSNFHRYVREGVLAQEWAAPVVSAFAIGGLKPTL
jgi:REP-associated tyrosine transposase